MTIFTTILEVDYDREGDTGGSNVKTWIDAQTGTTVNWCTITAVGSQGLVLVVIDKT